MNALIVGATAAAIAMTAPVQAQTTWPNTMVARLEALALLQSLNSELLSHDSATETLRLWCQDHHLNPATRITATRVRGSDRPADASVLQALGAGPDDVIGYRHVRLACGDRVLSEADNWYLPGRLTPEMNATLDRTDTPFGVAVRGLNYRRHTLSAVLLFKPLPDGWDRGVLILPDHPIVIPDKVLRHRAVLSTPGGVPFSLVVETYTDKILPDRAPGL